MALVWIRAELGLSVPRGGAQFFLLIGFLEVQVWLDDGRLRA